jgi:hypothetical protein
MARLTVALRVHVAKEGPKRRGPLQAFLVRLADVLEEMGAFVRRLESHTRRN